MYERLEIVMILLRCQSVYEVEKASALFYKIMKDSNDFRKRDFIARGANRKIAVLENKL